MSIIQRHAIVSYTANEMFQLVNDIEKYPQFIPWCCSSHVLSRSEHEIKATLCFARGGIQKCFTTSNRMQPDKMIDISLINGPFRRLHGYWRFDPINEFSTKVSFDVDFEFTNRLVSFAFGTFFNQIANNLVASFCERAKQVYGERTHPHDRNSSGGW